MICPKCGAHANPTGYLIKGNGVIIFYRCECGFAFESPFVPIKNMCEVK